MAVDRPLVQLTLKQERARERLLRLIRAKVRGRFALFGGSSEGLFMPDGTEEVSGCVVDEQGRVFSFWLEWDPELGAPTLGQWEQIEPETHWTDSHEYREARKEVGLEPA